MTGDVDALVCGQVVRLVCFCNAFRLVRQPHCVCSAFVTIRTNVTSLNELYYKSPKIRIPSLLFYLALTTPHRDLTDP